MSRRTRVCRESFRASPDLVRETVIIITSNAELAQSDEWKPDSALGNGIARDNLSIRTNLCGYYDQGYGENRQQTITVAVSCLGTVGIPLRRHVVLAMRNKKIFRGAFSGGGPHLFVRSLEGILRLRITAHAVNFT